MIGRGASIAVIVRGHAPSEKLSSLIASAADHRGFDTYVSTNDTDGVFDVGAHMRVPYTLDTFRQLGFEPQDDYFLIQCSDLLFEHYRRSLPGYDFYVLMEYDIHLARDGGTYLDELAAKLRSPEWRDLDMTGTHVSYRGEGWSHHANAARLFPAVHMVFFPFVVLSNRAIDRLYALRVAEGPRDMPTAKRVFCEAIVASALVTDDAYRTADLNEVIAGSYERRSFYWGLPMLQDRGAPEPDGAQVLHPVYAAPEFLEAHLHDAVHHGSLPQFRAALRLADPPVAAELQEGLLARARQLEAELAVVRPGPAVAPTDAGLLRDIPVVLVGGGASPNVGAAAMTSIGGSPVLQHVVERHIALGARELVLCVGDGDDGARGWALRRLYGAGPIELDFATGSVTAHEAAPARALRLSILPTQPGEAMLALLRRVGAALGERPFLAVFADALCDVDVAAVVGQSDGERPPITVVTARPSGLVTALDGEIAVLLDTPPWLGTLTGHAGCMLIDPSFFAQAWPGEELGEVLHRLEAEGRLVRHDHPGVYQDAGGPLKDAVLAELFAKGAFAQPKSGSST